MGFGAAQVPDGRVNFGVKTFVRIAFFSINFLLAVVFMTATGIAVGSNESPYSFLGGIAFFPFAVAFTVAEWIAWYRHRRVVEKALGVFCLAIAGLGGFAVLANTLEAIRHGWPDGFGWFVSIGSCIAVYFGACGVWRIWVAPKRCS